MLGMFLWCVQNELGLGEVEGSGTDVSGRGGTQKWPRKPCCWELGRKLTFGEMTRFQRPDVLPFDLAFVNKLLYTCH